MQFWHPKAGGDRVMLLVYIVAKIRSYEKIPIPQKTIARSVRIADPVCTAAGSVIPLSWAEEVEGIARMIPLAPARIPM